MPNAHPLNTPTPAPMSPAHAAKAAGCSRRTIMRAIEAKELLAHRDNRNNWKIDAQDLERWASAQCAPTGQDDPPAHLSAQSETAIELAAARATIDQLTARLTAAETDRDHWRGMAEKLADRQPEPQPPRRPWWPWQKGK